MRDTLDYAAIGSNLGRQLMQSTNAYENGYTKMGQMLAQQGMQQAHSNLYNEQTKQLRQQAEAMKPENITRASAGFFGLTDDKADELHGYFSRGNWGENPAYEDDTRQMTMAPTPKAAPDWAKPDTLSRVMQMRSALNAQQGLTGKTDFNNLIQGLKGIWDQEQLDQAKSGRFTPEMARGLNTLEAAKKGSLYNFHEFGTGDQSTGSLQFNQPYLAKNSSAIAQNYAQAANATASADLHRAQAENERANGAGGGKPPPGYRWSPDGSLAAIPGGPADQKIQGAYNQDTASRIAASSAMDRLANEAKVLMQHPGLAGITGVSGSFPNMPGSNAANAAAKFDTLKSQIAFSTLQAMRDASKTGGALGAVSEKELVMLQNNLAALDKAQSYEEMKKSLDSIIKFTDESKGRIDQAYNMKHGGRQPAASSGDISAALSTRTKSPADYGYGSATQAVLEARDLVAKRPHAKAEAIRRLEEMGITNHGIK